MERILLTFLIGFYAFSGLCQDWYQVGPTVYGDATDDDFGYSVAISADGSTFAAGAGAHDPSSALNLAGQAKVFQNLNDNWVQVGTDIDGQASNERFGSAAAMSSDGSTIAVAGNALVRVYENVSGVWTQVGSDLSGSFIVAMNDDGTILVISSTIDIVVYENVGGTWIQKGSSFSGAYIRSVDLSADGLKMVYNDGSANNQVGQAYVLEYNSGISDWVQVGAAIDGITTSGGFGFSTKMSDNGSTILVSAPFSSINGSGAGEVFLYQLISGTWTQVGSTFLGTAVSNLGKVTALSGDGDVFAIFSNEINSNGVRGLVKVYNNESGVFSQLGASIEAELNTDIPSDIAMSNDGRRLVIGTSNSQEDPEAFNYEGAVRVYEYMYQVSLEQQICVGGSIDFGGNLVTATGTYKDLLTASDGLDSLVTLVVVDTDLVISTSKTDNICYGGTSGEININASGGTGPYDYSIDGVNYSSSHMFSLLEAGNYTSYLKDANGCELTEIITISEPIPLQYDLISSTDASCNNEASGSINITAIGGTGVIEFSVDGVNFGASPMTGLAAGGYDITARDANGCESLLFANFLVEEPVATVAPTITGGGTTVYGTPVTNLVVTPNASDEEADYFYFVGIVGGALYKSDGVTEINAGDFITVAEGAAGLVFDPFYWGSAIGFGVQSAAQNRTICIGGATTSKTISVSKAPLNISLLDETISYGSSPSLIVQYSGFVNDEDETTLTTAPVISNTVSNATAPGSYTASISGAVSTNYEYTYSDATITVEKAPLAVTAGSVTKHYGEANPSLSYVYSGFVNGEDQSVLDTEPIISTLGDDFSDVGSYAISASGGADDNYTFDYADGVMTILKADQTLSFDPITDIDIAFNSSLSLTATTSSGLAITYTLIEGDGVINDDVLTINATDNFTIEASQAGDVNFNGATVVQQSFMVYDSRKADQTISFSAPQDVEYGDQIDLDGTASSTLTVAYELVSGEGSINSNVLTIAGVGTYEILASQVGDAAYNAALDVTQSFTVAKAVLRASANDLVIIEGDQIPALEVAYDGFKLTDDKNVLDSEPTISTDATVQSQAGAYDIVLTGGSDDLYDFDLVNGLLTIEVLLGINDELTQAIYPNPMVDILNVDVNDLGSVELIDLSGHIILKTNRTKGVDVSEIPQGVYFVRVKNLQGAILITRKVIKE